jgi:hypothetical protein
LRQEFHRSDIPRIASIQGWRLNALGAARLITERWVPHPAAAPTNHAGRISGCTRGPDRAFVKEARFLCRNGATIAQLADVFSVSTQTVNSWRSKYPAFGAAVNEGRLEQFDPRIERSLAERAMGYAVDIVEPFVIDGEIIDHPVRKVYPPDVTAQIFWLKNRKPDKYRDVHRVDLNARVLRSAEEIRMELINELQDAFNKGLLDLKALPAPSKKGNGQRKVRRVSESWPGGR